MKEQIKNLVGNFHEIQAMPQDDAGERFAKEKKLKSWFKKAENIDIKPDVGLWLSIESLTISSSGVSHYHFSFIEAFENITILITAKFGGKQKLHEVRSLIHLPD